MKIAHIIIKFSKKHWGGAEEFVLNTCTLLQNQGNDVTILAPNVLNDIEYEIINNVKVKRFNYFYPYFGKKDKDMLAKRGTGVISIGILNDILKNDYDLVHLHLHNSLSTSCAYLCKAIKKKFILHIHSPYIEEVEFLNGNNSVYANNKSQKLISNYGLKINKLIKSFVSTKKALQFANVVLWANGVDNITFSNKYPTKKTFFMPNGFDVRNVTGGNDKEFKDRYKIKSTEKILLYVANYYYIKNQLHFLKIYKSLCEKEKEIKLVLVGKIADQTYYSEMVRYIEENNLTDRVILINGVEHGSDDFKNIFAASDIFIMPSKYEAFSLVLVEAMANRKPIIANLVGGNSCVIQNEYNGFFIDMVNENSIEEASDKIKSIINNEESLKKVSSNAFEVANNNYTWEKIVKKLIEIYNEI